MRISNVVLIATLSLAMAGFTYGQGPVSGDIKAFIVTQDKDGTEKIRTAQEAAPGEVMEFQITFTNEGEESVTGIKVVDSIPENTLFISDSQGSDVSANFEVSIDGGQSYESEPVRRVETQADGTQVEVIIPADQYTHVRWVANDALASDGGQHRFSYRVSIK